MKRMIQYLINPIWWRLSYLKWFLIGKYSQDVIRALESLVCQNKIKATKKPFYFLKGATYTERPDMRKQFQGMCGGMEYYRKRGQL